MKVMYSIEEGGENPLTDEEQKQIFAKNLNRYIALSQKMQKDVAKDLGVNVTTFNMWCTGKAMPGTGKYERWLIISE